MPQNNKVKHPSISKKIEKNLFLKILSVYPAKRKIPISKISFSILAERGWVKLNTTQKQFPHKKVSVSFCMVSNYIQVLYLDAFPAIRLHLDTITICVMQ